MKPVSRSIFSSNKNYQISSTNNSLQKLKYSRNGCYSNSSILKLLFYFLFPVTTERPVQVNVVKVKKSDKGDFYKRQTSWALRDLAVVDAKDAVKVCAVL